MMVLLILQRRIVMKGYHIFCLFTLCFIFSDKNAFFKNLNTII
jgi:hypothetical protein